MKEDNSFYPDSESKIESELFALIKSITNLNIKYQKGIVNENFFRKALKNSMNNLMELNLKLKEKNLILTNLLKKMRISEEYHSVIDIVNRVSSLNLSNNTYFHKNHTFLELPGITSEITSSFITLMDALTLEGLTKYDFILNLFDELVYNLSNFPGMEHILVEVKTIQKKAKNNLVESVSQPKLKEDLIEYLYELFKEFQSKLKVKP
ncbi:MAG: hypothetical protein ACFE9Z_04120 [Promethearchaeota archaeon]